MFFISKYFMSFFMILFLIVEYWFVLEKANEKGWKALIPFYGDYTVCKIAKKEKIFWWKLGIVGLIFVTLALMVETSIVKFMGFRLMKNTFSFTSAFYLLLFMVECVLLIVLDIKQSIAIAKAFGKSTGFGAGIAFLEPIFIGILAFNENINYIEGLKETEIKQVETENKMAKPIEAEVAIEENFDSENEN